MDSINGAISLFSAELVLILLISVLLDARRRKAFPPLSGLVLLVSGLTVLLCGGLAMTLFQHRPIPRGVMQLAVAAGIFTNLGTYPSYVIRVMELEDPAVRRIERLNRWVCVLEGLLWVLAVFFSPYFNWKTAHFLDSRMHSYLGIAGVISAGLTLSLLRLCRRRLKLEELFCMVAGPLLPLFSLLVERLLSGLKPIYPFFAILIYLNIIHVGRHRRELLEEKRLEAEQYRLRMTLNRVAPHFLCNILTSIYYLCQQDPRKAETAICDLSGYLRSMLPAEDHGRRVRFPQELELVRNYLDLERLLLGDRLRLELDIREQDFSLPPFTLQPLVENAVKYGFSADGVCRISVTSRREGENYRITVRDRGQGFDTGALEGLRRPSGTSNVRRILELTGSGRLELHSALGAGTTAQVVIFGGDHPEKTEKRNEKSRKTNSKLT